MNITVATFCMGLTVKLRGLATAARLEPLAHAFFLRPQRYYQRSRLVQRLLDIARRFLTYHDVANFLRYSNELKECLMDWTGRTPF